MKNIFETIDFKTCVYRDFSVVKYRSYAPWNFQTTAYSYKIIDRELQNDFKNWYFANLYVIIMLTPKLENLAAYF